MVPLPQRCAHQRHTTPPAACLAQSAAAMPAAQRGCRSRRQTRCQRAGGRQCRPTPAVNAAGCRRSVSAAVCLARSGARHGSCAAAPLPPPPPMLLPPRSLLPPPLPLPLLLQPLTSRCPAPAAPPCCAAIKHKTVSKRVTRSVISAQRQTCYHGKQRHATANLLARINCTAPHSVLRALLPARGGALPWQWHVTHCVTVPLLSLLSSLLLSSLDSSRLAPPRYA